MCVLGGGYMCVCGGEGVRAYVHACVHACVIASEVRGGSYLDRCMERWGRILSGQQQGVNLWDFHRAIAISNDSFGVGTCLWTGGRKVLPGQM